MTGRPASPALWGWCRAIGNVVVIALLLTAEKGVGAVELPAHGCRFDLATSDLSIVLLADPARWPSWVEAKEPARTRYVEREVARRRAVQLVNNVLVADGPGVLEVDTQGVAGTDGELDRIREALAALVLG